MCTENLTHDFYSNKLTKRSQNIKLNYNYLKIIIWRRPLDLMSLKIWAQWYVMSHASDSFINHPNPSGFHFQIIYSSSFKLKTSQQLIENKWFISNFLIPFFSSFFAQNCSLSNANDLKKMIRTMFTSRQQICQE